MPDRQRKLESQPVVWIVEVSGHQIDRMPEMSAKRVAVHALGPRCLAQPAVGEGLLERTRQVRAVRSVEVQEPPDPVADVLRGPATVEASSSASASSRRRRRP
jgi:hypothetical protein